MKKLLLIPMIFLFATATQAQDNNKTKRNDSSKRSAVQKSPEQRAERITKKMTKQLDLNAEQQEKIHELSLEQAKQQAEQMQLFKERMAQMKADQAKTQEQLELILSPEQLQQWKEADRKQKRSRMGHMDRRKKEFKRRPGMIKKKEFSEPMTPATTTPAAEA